MTDLKPTNLFLVGGDVGRVKVLDFGIARRLAMAPAMTQTGMVVGTPEYMAPEQARGVRDLTPAADVFSLGCVLYECLAGFAPFVADHIAAVLVRILFEEPIPVEECRPGLPVAVTDLVGRLLAKDPLRRPADAAALRTELAALGEQPEPTLASPQPKAALFADQEQSLLSMVLAAPPEEAADLEVTLRPGEVLPAAERHDLLQALQSLGVTADFLASGALVATVPSSGSATDQVTRAARAALLVQERWPAAVVSLATGRGAINGRTAVGEMVELAARSLKSASQPWQVKLAKGVRIDSLSAKLLAGRFVQTPQPHGGLVLGEECEVDDSRPLLGKSTPCVGRESELGTLELQLGGCIEDSEARVMLITAPPGLGKSRLRHEFLRRVAQRSQPVTLLSGRGDLMSAGAPYGILGQALRQICGLSGGESMAEQRACLGERLGLHVPPAERERVVLFLGELASVPFPANGNVMLLAAREDPHILRDRVRRAFLDWLTAECRVLPVLVVFDDLQWGDALSVGLVEEALRELRATPLFVLALARPELYENFPKLWLNHNRQELALKGLSKRACERLAQQVLGKQVAKEILGHLFERSAGNVLFLEELIRAAATGQADDQPETVVAMLQARIGRFEPGARKALRAAAVFGQTFWAGGVAAVLGLPQTAAEVASWLSALIDAKVIEPHRESRLANEKEYSFRHALVRDAAHSLLTAKDLVTGNRLAGIFLEAAGERDAALIAEHYERGGDKTQAATLYSRAAECAWDNFASEGVLRWVERGLACGAVGELLGTLRSLESNAALLLGQFDRGYLMARAALLLLRPGSLAWTRAMYGACQGAVFGPPEWQQQFPSLVEQLLAVDPEPDAEAFYAETVSHMAASLSWVAPAAQVDRALHRLAAVSESAAARNPAVRRHFYSALGRCCRMSFRAPWQRVQAAAVAVRLCIESGDLRNLPLALVSEEAWSELGDPDKAIQRMGAHATRDQQTEEPTMRMIARVMTASVLAKQAAPAGLAQATAYAREALSCLGPFPLTAVLAHDTLARVLLTQGKPAEAEAQAREACLFLAPIPVWEASAYATLIQALLAQGQVAAATAAAERGLHILARFGCIGQSEVELRLTISESFAAAADHDRARNELQETLRQIQLRADDVTDLFWKNSYLTRNPYCARATQLAKEWGLTWPSAAGAPFQGGLTCALIPVLTMSADRHDAV